jgi:hypothetical protein
MSVLHPRNRLVNFRLSEDEFERLKSSCAIQGARSVSDFARTAVLERMQDGVHHGSSETRVHQLDHKVSELELRVGQLLNLIHATGQSSNGSSSLGEMRTSELPTTELRADAARIP